MSHRDTGFAVRQNDTQEIWRRIRLGLFAVALSISLALGYIGVSSNAAGVLHIAERAGTYQQAHTGLSPQLQARMRPMPSCLGTPSDCH